MTGDPISGYAHAVADVLRGAFGDRLAGVWLSGSTALGDLVPATSDVDLIAVVEDEVDERALVAAAAGVEAVPCPLRGVELVVLRRAEAAAASGRFALNLNAGPRMPRRLSLDPAEEPGHWFVLDTAIVRAHGRVVEGPPPSTVFGTVSRRRILEALAASLRWHAAEEANSANAVLNACRAWRYAETGRLGSKSEAAAWVRGRGLDPVVAAAVRIRLGEPGPIDAAAAEAVVARARLAVAEAAAEAGEDDAGR